MCKVSHVENNLAMYTRHWQWQNDDDIDGAGNS